MGAIMTWEPEGEGVTYIVPLAPAASSHTISVRTIFAGTGAFTAAPPDQAPADPGALFAGQQARVALTRCLLWSRAIDS